MLRCCQQGVYFSPLCWSCNFDLSGEHTHAGNWHTQHTHCHTYTHSACMWFNEQSRSGIPSKKTWVTTGAELQLLKHRRIMQISCFPCFTFNLGAHLTKGWPGNLQRYSYRDRRHTDCFTDPRSIRCGRCGQDIYLGYMVIPLILGQWLYVSTVL